MRLKNLSSLSYGLLVRHENGIKIDNELVSSLLKNYVLEFFKLKIVYHDQSDIDKKYTKICLKTINKLIENAIRSELVDMESGAAATQDMKFEERNEKWLIFLDDILL